MNTAAARIARVVVHPDYRSEGFGALLVRVALEWAKERGAPEARREKHLVYTIAQMARYHPFFEKVGFRYLFDTASGRPVLFYPLTEEAEAHLERFLREDPYAKAHGGRLYKPRFGRVPGLPGPIRLRGVHKAYRSHLDLEGLSREVQEALLAFGVKARVVERAVLRGASLEIPPGSLVVLAGASGAGKTTLLRLLLGEAPDAGEVAVPPGRRVAYIPGEREVDLGEDPILEAVYRRLKDVGAAIEVLNRVGLSDAVLYRARPHELSTGQRERFRLALLLAERPDLLLIDEFAAHLDVPTARRVALGLGKLCREAGVTLVAATHRPEVVAALDPDLLVYVGYGGLPPYLGEVHEHDPARAPGHVEGLLVAEGVFQDPGVEGLVLGVGPEEGLLRQVLLLVGEELLHAERPLHPHEVRLADEPPPLTMPKGPRWRVLRLRISQTFLPSTMRLA